MCRWFKSILPHKFEFVTDNALVVGEKVDGMQLSSLNSHGSVVQVLVLSGLQRAQSIVGGIHGHTAESLGQPLAVDTRLIIL